MKELIYDLQASLLDREGFTSLEEYEKFTTEFLVYLENADITRIVSPSHANYIFFQFSEGLSHKITRPLNSDIYVSNKDEFKALFVSFCGLLADAVKYKQEFKNQPSYGDAVENNTINKIIYTIQQSIGCVSDSLDNNNQARKKVGQLFEKLIKIVVKRLGFECEPRTVRLPVPEYAGYTMPYELDVVISRNKIEAQKEPYFIHDTEVVGSVKTTSKDRIDKIFLDKYLLTKLLGRDIPVIAIFLHDVQRAVRGNSIFGINSTFKTNHFLGYTVALNKLDGVYYVDPRPEMLVNERLREQIRGFQQLVLEDLWLLSD